MSSTDSAFNPYTQNITLLLADGVTPFNISVADLNQYNYYNTKVAANYASQIGACIIMFIVVLMVTSPGKRKARLFWINLTSLALAIIRPILLTLYWTGPWVELFGFFAYDFSAVPRSAYANSIAALVVQLLLVCTVELSLFLQVQVITRAMMGDCYRWMLLAASGIVIALTVGLRFGSMVRNIEGIMAAADTLHLQWIASGALIMETISIWYFCLIFVAKLGYCMYERKKKLSLQPWGPMDIICIMGGCTMIIPSIFAILEYFPASTFPEAGSIALTLVAIFLPLSSIWAAATPEGSSPIFRSDRTEGSDRQKLGSYSIGQTQRSRFDSNAEAERKGSVISPSTVATMIEHVSNNRSTTHSDQDLDDFLNIETAGMGGVRVDRTYSVHSGRGAGKGSSL